MMRPYSWPKRGSADSHQLGNRVGDFQRDYQVDWWQKFFFQSGKVPLSVSEKKLNRSVVPELHFFISVEHNDCALKKHSATDFMKSIFII